MTPPLGISAGEVGEVASYLTRRMGLSFAGSRREHLVREIAHAMASAGVESGARYCARIDTDEREFDELVARVTVGESYFFREPEQIEVLRKTVLPERRRAIGATRPLRLWSAGCAAGQEAYTLAMVLEEVGLAGTAKIEATDISNEALRVAEKGFYGRWALRAVSEQQQSAYFSQTALGFRVQERFARPITFRTLNLLDPSQPAPRDVDVIMCRNVLIYFTPEAVARAGERLAAALAPGAWLITGSSDPSLRGIDGLEATSTPAGIVYRRIPTSIDASGAPARAEGAEPARSEPAGRRQNASHTYIDITTRERRFPPTSAVDPPPPARDRTQTPEEDVATIRSMGGRGELAAALDTANDAVARFPLHPELRYLQAVVLMESGRPAEAAASARAALYLDPRLVVAHLVLARCDAALERREAAARSLRTAVALLRAMPEDALVPMSDGEPAARLAAMASAHGEALVGPTGGGGKRG